MGYETDKLTYYIDQIANGVKTAMPLQIMQQVKDRLAAYEKFEKTNGWIPVEEFMPAGDEWVDIWVIHDNGAPPGRWTNMHFCPSLKDWASPDHMSFGDRHNNCPRLPGKATHWRPIMKGPNNE